MKQRVISISALFSGQEITGTEAGELKAQIVDYIGELWTGCLILDISAIRYIDSGGLGLLVALSKLMKGRAGDLKLYGCSAQVRSIRRAARHSRTAKKASWSSPRSPRRRCR